MHAVRVRTEKAHRRRDFRGTYPAVSRIAFILLLAGLITAHTATAAEEPPTPACVGTVLFQHDTEIELPFVVVEQSGPYAGNATRLLFRAFVSVEEKTLTLSGIEFGLDGPGRIRPRKPWHRRLRTVPAGPAAVREILARLSVMARAAGFKTLVLEGRRDTGMRARRSEGQRRIVVTVPL